MVARNPLFRGRWTAKKFGATVVDDIWPEVTFFTLVSTMVVLVSEFTSVNLGVSNQLLTVLGLVLGLVISFRTSSAYERYQDGRKMWTNITSGSRNLAKLIWVEVPIDRPSTDLEGRTVTPLEAILEKKTMVNLLQAFSVSVKHLLRGEQGVYYEDLYPLISFLPRYATATEENSGDEADKLPLWHLRDEYQHLVDNVTMAASIVIPEVEPKEEGAHNKRAHGEGPNKVEARNLVESSSISVATNHSEETNRGPSGGFQRLPRNNTLFDPEVILPQVESPLPLRPARNPPEPAMSDYMPILKFLRWAWQVLTLKKWRSKEEREQVRRHRKRKAYADIVESHVPLEICLVLSNYASYLMRSNLLQPAVATGMSNTLSLFQDTVAHLERICNTPLPFAYQAHLRMSLWIYLTLLPFQIYTAYRYITIPATAFASFTLLGFLEIGQEIENPFNYDFNDLDLDYFCLAIERDLHLITAHTNPHPHEFIFTRLNQPLAPSDRRSAMDLVSNKDKQYIPLDRQAEPGIGGIKKTLVAGWKEVDTLTRKR